MKILGVNGGFVAHAGLKVAPSFLQECLTQNIGVNDATDEMRRWQQDGFGQKRRKES